MRRRFHFADAFWFRVPLKALVVAVTVFAVLSLYPALIHGTRQDHERALFGFTVLAAFIVAATVFTVAVNDSYVDIDGKSLFVRFEAFFAMEVPLADVVAVRRIDPRPRWRYRFGLSTNFEDRISCSHGGPLVEIELSRPHNARLWPRRIPVTRLWLGLRDADALLAVLDRVTQRDFTADLAAAA
jgi:hypothetical protein